ncbi:MAG: hypothetical protein A2Y23_11370 [Clostridiales bacterium GWB2_37_7]|nr:MAG: hypothetical protein A2Y23_11370 [Clostridiales bacterium GWB2_37_7]
MTNLFWYVSLAIIGVVSAAYAIYKKRGIYKVSTLLVFYLFTACFTWIGEFIVLGLFNAYAYKTGLLTDPWAQNLLGHLLINTTLYPSAAIVMVTYSLRYGWIFSVATIFTLLEYLFVNLRIYEQHWWRYYMTFIAVVIFLSIYHQWFTKMNQRRYGSTRAITFYFVAMIIIHFPAPLLLLLGKQYYQISLINNLVGNLFLSSIIIIFFYHLIEAFLLVLCTCVLKKWYWKLLPFIISVIVQISFVKMNILIIKNSWSLVYTLLIYELFIAIFILIEKYTLKPDFSKLK